MGMKNKYNYDKELDENDKIIGVEILKALRFMDKVESIKYCSYLV